MSRVLHLCDYPNLHAGSFIPMLSEILAASQARGWGAEAAFIGGLEGNAWEDGLRERGVRTYMLEGGSRARLVREVGELVGTGPEPVVLHTHFTTFDIPAGIVARRRRGCALFWHIHTVLSRSPVTIARNVAKFGAFRRRLDGIFVPAANIGEGIVRRLAPADRVILLPSPIDPAEYALPLPEQRARSRTELDIPEATAALLHIGRAWKLKGGDVFFEAVRRLREQGRDVIGLTLRGGEPAEREADRLGVGDSVRVLGRVEDIRALYAASDCFVAPSRGEGMPFSLVEALASGVPVVASDHLPGHLLLSDSVDACLTVPGDAGGIAAGVARILDRPESQARRERDQARLWISENLDLATAAERVVDCYAGALAAHELPD